MYIYIYIINKDRKTTPKQQQNTKNVKKNTENTCKSRKFNESMTFDVYTNMYIYIYIYIYV